MSYKLLGQNMDELLKARTQSAPPPPAAHAAPTYDLRPTGLVKPSLDTTPRVKTMGVTRF